MEYIKSISGFGFSFWVNEDDFMVTVKNEIPKPRIIAVCGSEISNKTRILFYIAQMPYASHLFSSKSSILGNFRVSEKTAPNKWLNTAV